MDLVRAVDNLSTGDADNTRDLLDSGRFTQVVADVCDGIDIAAKIDAVLHFASPASPGDYLTHALQTLKVGSIGTTSALELALGKNARFLLALNGSETDGDPIGSILDQQTYWGKR